MIMEDSKNKVIELVEEALRAKAMPIPALADDTLLLGGGLGIDSLDLAGIVVGLSDIYQKDPFANGFIEFRTIGELAGLYAG